MLFASKCTQEHPCPRVPEQGLKVSFAIRSFSRGLGWSPRSHDACEYG